MRRRRSSYLMALLAGVLTLGLGQAHAQEKRIVLMPFSGSGAKHLRRAAAEVIQESNQIIPDRDYKRTAREHDARGLAPENVAVVAAELSADGVLLGEVDRSDGKRQGVLRLLSGKTGEQVAEIRIDTKRRRLDQEEQDELRARLLEAIRALPSLDQPGSAASGEDGEEPGDAGDDVPIELAPGAISSDGAAGAQAGDDDTPARTDEASPAVDGPAGEGSVRPGISVAAGLSFTSRVLRSSTEGDVRGPEYTGQPAPGLRIDVEVHPLLLDLPFDVPARDALRNLGIRATFDRVVGLTSKLPYVDPQDAAAGEMTAELGTSQMRLGMGLTYRILFGRGPLASSLVVGLGYDRQWFSVDQGDAPPGVPVDLPDVAYASIDPSLAFRYPLSEVLAITGSGRLLLVTGTGEMQDSDQFGEGSALGFDLAAEAEYRLDPRLSVRAGLRFMDITTAFDGTGPESNMRDGDPTTVDVTGITDLYIGGHVSAGYAF